MRNKFGLWILILFIFMSIPFAYGEEVVTEKKEGKSGAFDFVESTPANSAKDVELDGQIKLLFNKNVVNFTVKDNNEKCFSIKDAGNKEVPIDVIFADDQIEPDKKREIILCPKKPFDENTTYVVHILPTLKAKNGDSLDRDVAISFTTLSLQSKEDSPPPEEKPKDKPVEKDAEKPASTEPVGKDVEKPASTEPVQKQEESIAGKERETDNVGRDGNDTGVFNDNLEDTNKDADLAKSENPGLEPDAESGETGEDSDEQKGLSVTTKQIIRTIAVGVALVLALIFKKRAQM